MQYTVRAGQTLFGEVDLPAAALAAAVLLPRRAYEAIRPIVRESTSAFLELGLLGAASRRALLEALTDCLLLQHLRDA